jgi:hypothetical protein
MNNGKGPKPIEYKYDDRHQSSLASIIVAERAGIPYYIRNIEDLINYGLQETVISYDMLEAFCRIHKDTHQSQVKYLLNDRGIQLVSEGDWFRVGADGYSKGQPHGLLVNKRTRIEDRIAEINSDYRNIIFVRLELLYKSLDMLAYQKDEIINEHKIKSLFNKKTHKQLLALKILQKTNKGHVVDKGALSLAQQIEDKGRKRAFEEYLQSKILLNPHIWFLLAVIKLMNEKNMESAEDILDFCYNSHYDKAFIHVFLSGRTSNGIKPILQYQDVCYRCTNRADCLGSECTEPEVIRKQLLNIRDIEAVKYLQEVKDTQSLAPIINRPIYQKFIFSYNIVVLLKGFLRNIGVIKWDRILYKDQGIYCPKVDKWRLEDDFLV